jgi:zinc D-Ala-D-Ala carboxypeptidase
MTQLTAHFSLAEMTASQTARESGLSNECPAELLPDLVDTAMMMERIRAALTAAKGEPVPIMVSSAYRSPDVNRAVGGSKNSDHTRAQAVDFRAPAFGTPYDICKFLAPRIDALGIGQIIHEFGHWVHVSRAVPPKVSNRVITASSAGFELGIQEVA